jgi:hypothetical protein
MNGRKEYKDILYLIDFGLCKKYRDPKTGQHVKFKNNRKLNGTARYASIHALEGYELSRRDDLEELCYVLIYFLNGHLPWGKIKNKNRQERYSLILNMKKKMSEEILVGDKSNIEFIEFVKYCRKLKFEEKPDYDYLRGLMINCICKNKKSIDNFYNLDILKNPLFHSQENKNTILIEYPLKNVSKKKNNRCKSTKRYKVNIEDQLGVENIANNEDYDNKIIRESRSSTLGYIEEKVRSYSLCKKRGFEEINQEIKNKNKKNDKNCINLRLINKNQTVYRNSNDIKTPNDIQTPAFKMKRNYRRTRFEFIKRSLGIEQKRTEMFKSSSNGKNNVKDNDSNENNSNNINNSNNKDDGCTII